MNKLSIDLDSYLSSKAGSSSYADILAATQAFISGTYQDILANDLTMDDRRLIKDYIRQYLITKDIKLTDGMSVSELTEKLYMDMAEFSFITSWLRNAEEMQLEEININAWNDIEIVSAGHKRKAEERFISPQHAIDVVRRMLQASDTCPFVNDVRLKKRKIFCQKEERSDE